MKDINYMYSYLKDNLKESRYEHVLGVVKMAKTLAKLNFVDEFKVEVAALCHDIAKNKTPEELVQIINENNIILSKEEEVTTELWHSIVAPILAKNEFEIDDEEILSAARWHTTGKENMTKLEKIIYIADMIEEGRSFKGLEKIREEALKNLDKGVLLGLTHTINYLVNKGYVVDGNTLKARNFLIVNVD